MRNNTDAGADLHQAAKREQPGKVKAAPAPLPSPKVASYMRVSVASENGQTSYELQKLQYETMLRRQRNSLRGQ